MRWRDGRDYESKSEQGTKLSISLHSRPDWAWSDFTVTMMDREVQPYFSRTRLWQWGIIEYGITEQNSAFWIKKQTNIICCCLRAAQISLASSQCFWLFKKKKQYKGRNVMQTLTPDSNLILPPLKNKHFRSSAFPIPELLGIEEPLPGGVFPMAIEWCLFLIPACLIRSTSCRKEKLIGQIQKLIPSRCWKMFGHLWPNTLHGILAMGRSGWCEGVAVGDHQAPNP